MNIIKGKIFFYMTQLLPCMRPIVIDWFNKLII